MKTVLITLVFALAGATGAFAADARSAFDTGNYAEAAKQLEAAVATPPSAETYYDLGLAYEKAGVPGSAALNYERALRLDPGLNPARNSLALLAAAHGITLPPRTWLDDVSAVAHPDTWIVVGAALAWAGIFGVLAFSRSPKRGGRLAVAILVIVAGIAALAAGGLADARLRPARPAVVTAKDGAEVLAAPAKNSTSVASLPAGSAVGVRSPRGAWAYVEVAGGAKGWVQTDRLTPMVPGEIF